MLAGVLGEAEPDLGEPAVVVTPEHYRFRRDPERALQLRAGQIVAGGAAQQVGRAVAGE